MQVVIDGETVLSMDSNTRFPGHMRRLLDRIDVEMDSGIKLQGELLENPDKMQRARYVAMSLIQAVEANNTEVVNAMSAYLVNRLPDLKKIHAVTVGPDVEMDLVFTELN